MSNTQSIENNPLTQCQRLPSFSLIKPEHVTPAIQWIINENKQKINDLLLTSPSTWQQLIVPLEALDETLNKAWSPVSHMNSVVNSENLRKAYNECIPLLTEYATAIGQNKKLYDAYVRLLESDGYSAFNAAQKRVIANTIRDFKLAGVALADDEKEHYKKLKQSLSQLTSKFDENVLDTTNAWEFNTTDNNHLTGLPESALSLAKQTAEQKQQDGWTFTLDFPMYMPVMLYADDSSLRQKFYQAYTTRASDQGPHDTQYNNSEIMDEILSLRHQISNLLGFNNYAERSLATKMAESPEQVLNFLNELAEHSLPIAKNELNELQNFAKQHFQVTQLNAWDIPYYSEKLKQHKYNVSQEDLKPYFPIHKVIKGMFDVVNRLYGIKIKAIDGIDCWHSDVSFYQITDENDQLRGEFYLDCYARKNKRGGAWMDECITRHQLDGKVDNPVAYLTCNFTPPIGDDPSLLTHDEVQTLFHEFGHGLHHMLTQVDYPEISGINGVLWDAVELPSQFMENWCWEKSAIDLFSGHYQTGEKLPDELFEKLYKAKNFQSGMQMVRQLEFSIFDFRIHHEYNPAKPGQIYHTLDQVRDLVAVIIPPKDNRFPHSFSHIFSGGYAAGYFSYKWAEVLSADAFSKFEDSGIFNAATGKEFLTNILEKGGSDNAMDLYVNFRGRKPEINALLRHSGIEKIPR